MVRGRASVSRLPLVRAPGGIVASGCATDRGDGRAVTPIPLLFGTGGRRRVRSRCNVLKITKCVNVFTLVFCGDAYGDSVPKPFRPNTEASHEVLYSRTGRHLRTRQRYFHGSADGSRPYARCSKWCSRSGQPTTDGTPALRARTNVTTLGISVHRPPQGREPPMRRGQRASRNQLPNL